jgi:hypothetical protein
MSVCECTSWVLQCFYIYQDLFYAIETSVGDPEPDPDPHIFGHPGPESALVRDRDPDPSLFSLRC